MRRIYEGSQFRVILEEGEPGQSCSSGVKAIIESEDDTFWHKTDSFDALWLGDLLRVVADAKDGIEETPDDNDWARRLRRSE